MHGDSNSSVYWSTRILELEQRQRDLNKWFDALKDAPLPHDFNITYECWLEYRDGGALPFTGGLLLQPQWVLDDFNYYDVLREHKALPVQISEAQRGWERALKNE